MLRRLVDANLFVVALAEGDDGLEWARYHQLFRELLRERLLAREGPAAVAELHRRAAGWFAGARAGRRGDRRRCWRPASRTQAARLVEGRVEATLDREDWATLWRWLRRLPDDADAAAAGAAARPRLRRPVPRPAAASMAARLAAATALLDAADPALAAGGGGDAPRPGGCHRGDALRHSGRRRRGGRRPRAGRCRAFPDPASYLGGARGTDSGSGCIRPGRRDEALRALGDPRTPPPPTRRPARDVLGLATIHLQAGELAAARRWAARLLEVSARRDLPLLIGWARYLLGRVAYELDELEEARAHFAAVAAERHRRHLVAVTEALLGLALTEQARGGRAGPSGCWASWTRRWPRRATTRRGRWSAPARRALALQRGDRAEAVRWLESGPPDSGECLMLHGVPAPDAGAGAAGARGAGRRGGGGGAAGGVRASAPSGSTPPAA